MQLWCPAIWRDPRSPAKVLLSVEYEKSESVDWLLTFEQMDEQTTQAVAEHAWGRYSSTGSGGTAWVENWDRITWPGHALHQQLCILRDVSQSIFLLFALIMCYSPSCRTPGMRSEGSIVSMVQSIHNTSRDSFNGNFNKGGFCNMNRHSLRIGMEAHSIQFTE